MKNDLRNLL
jgi:hypothetical protein